MCMYIVQAGMVRSGRSSCTVRACYDPDPAALHIWQHMTIRETMELSIKITIIMRETTFTDAFACLVLFDSESWSMDV